MSTVTPATLAQVQQDLSNLTSNLATVVADQTVLATANAALTGDQTAVTAATTQLTTDQATAAATYQQTLTDLASYYGGTNTPNAQKAHKVFSKRLGSYKSRAKTTINWADLLTEILALFQDLLPLIPTT